MDTGFLIAYCDERDPYHMHAIKWCEDIMRRADLYTLLIPCGVLYEALSTHFVKKPKSIENFEDLIMKRKNVKFISDQGCESLTESVLKEARKRPVSMTDTHLRYILRKQKVDIFITNNTKDFLDILRKSKIGHIYLIDIREGKAFLCS